jgi:hypothetical protein
METTNVLSLRRVKTQLIPELEQEEVQEKNLKS